MNEYFFIDGMIKYKPTDTEQGENNILELVMYAFLYRKNIINHVEKWIKYDNENENSNSHDNMTACLCHAAWSERWDLVEQIDKNGKYKHPRDLIFKLYLKKKWASYPLLPLLIPIFIFMAFKKYKIRPKFNERLKNFMFFGSYRGTRWERNNEIQIYENIFGKKYEIQHIYKTDTERLFWLRLNLPRRFKFIHFCHKIIKPLLEKKYQRPWIQVANDLYYEDVNHPNRHAEIYKRLPIRLK